MIHTFELSQDKKMSQTQHNRRNRHIQSEVLPYLVMAPNHMANQTLLAHAHLSVLLLHCVERDLDEAYSVPKDKCRQCLDKSGIPPGLM